MKNPKLHLLTILAAVATSGLPSQTFAQDGFDSGAIGSGIVRAIEAPGQAMKATSSNQMELPPIIAGKKSLTMPSFKMPSMQMPLSQSTSSTVPPIVSGSKKTGRATVPSLTMPKLNTSTRKLLPQRRTTKSSLPPVLSSQQAMAQTATPKSQPTPTATESDVKPIGTGMLAPIAAFAKNEVETGSESNQVQQTQYSSPAQRIARAFSPSSIPVRQGSSSRNIGGEVISGMGSPLPPVVNGSMVPGMSMGSMPQAPMISSGSELLGTPMMSAPTMAAPMTSYPEYSTQAAPTYFDTPAVSSSVMSGSVVAGGCNDCGSAGCGGVAGGCSDCASGGVSNCQACGPNGCYDASKINTNAGTFGSVSSARRYMYAEALYFTREDGDITNSNFGGLGDFGGSLGWRFTLGNRSDAVRGTEFSYFGTQPMEQSRSQTDSLGRLNSLFFTGGGFTGVETTTFFNATEQTQFKDTVLHSLEFNRVRWGWDVLKTFVGWRYFHMEDDYVMTSTNSFGTGTYRLDTANYAFGPQIGAELFYDIGYRFSFSMLGKYGAHVNFSQADTFLNNAGLDFLDNDTESVTLSTSAEIGLLAHYQVRPSVRMRAGYTALFLGNMATVSDNFTPGLSPLAGFDGRDADDTFFHGLSFGIEVYR